MGILPWMCIGRVCLIRELDVVDESSKGDERSEDVLVRSWICDDLGKFRPLGLSRDV